jgi:hypothetical protein
LTHALQGSTAVAVAGRCEGPVVVVPEGCPLTEHVSAPIVAGIDTHHDPQVLDLAFDRARTPPVCSWSSARLGAARAAHPLRCRSPAMGGYGENRGRRHHRALDGELPGGHRDNRVTSP